MKSFGEFAERWFHKAPMADSTKAMYQNILHADRGAETSGLDGREVAGLGRDQERHPKNHRLRAKCSVASLKSGRSWL